MHGKRGTELKMLYIAYGSNLHKGQMRRRCPDAVAVGAAIIPNTRLVFRGVADIEPAPGESCHVGIWHISREDEKALDRYEGVSTGLYRKEYLPLKVKRNGKETVENGLVYVMNSKSYGEPGSWYFETIETGYKNFGMPVEALKQAALDTMRRCRADRAMGAAVRKGAIEVESITHEWDGPLADVADHDGDYGAEFGRMYPSKAS